MPLVYGSAEYNASNDSDAKRLANEAYTRTPEYAAQQAAARKRAEEAAAKPKTPTQQGNQLLASSGQPGQYSTSGAYQVLGAGSSGGRGVGGASAQSTALNQLLGGGGGGGIPGLTGGPAGGGSAPALGPVGGGGGAAGAGSGNMIAAPQITKMTAQQNPYIAQIMQNSQNLFATPFDREAERSKTRRENSLQLNEARQLGAAGGRGGLWGSQQQQIENTQGQALAGQEAAFGDRQTAARMGLINSMTGVAGANTQDTAAQLSAQHAANALNLQASNAANDLNYRYNDLGVRARQGQLDSISRLLALV